MKRLALILCALCALVQPLSKQGIMMVYQLNKVYFASELCENRFVTGSDCHGKCHLRKELKKHTERESQSQLQQHAIDLMLYKAALFPLVPALPLIENNNRFLYLARTYATPYFSVFHPPRFKA